MYEKYEPILSVNLDFIIFGNNFNSNVYNVIYTICLLDSQSQRDRPVLGIRNYMPLLNYNNGHIQNEQPFDILIEITHHIHKFIMATHNRANFR